MKKLFIFFVMSIFCLDVWSHGKLNPPCKFGLKLGLGMHTITGFPTKTKPKLALMGGMWVQIKISKSWAMQAELYELGKGTGAGAPRGYGDYLLRLSYFEVPILFQYSKKNGYVEFGPALAALVNTGEYTDRPAFPFETDLYPFSNKDFTFNLGAGFIVKEKWFVGLRLSHSLLPIRKQLPGASHQVYNRSIMLSVSRQIRFKASRNKQSEDID